MSELIRATVARGTVIGCGVNAHGQPSYAVPSVEYGPGAEVWLPVDEVARLRLSGALVREPVADRRNGMSA